MTELLNNRVVVIPLGVWFISQFTKVLIGLWMDRRLNLSYILASGGMPSSHSALVASLTTTIASVEGLGSPLFGATVILAAIVMYDAAGVRRTVGTHAKVLNLLLDELLVRHKFDEKRLRELVGHTPLQVLVGAILGVVASLWLVRF